MVANGVENVVLLAVVKNLFNKLLVRRWSLRHRFAKIGHVYCIKVN